ncbi:tRNA pseudouridine(13) synthase TruD [Planctobacterium marinum]|uniref:tRNA pseudouridine(13) synthase TruD n=1 Tax=Planctobacterium marinum TaxID=1631968 RepID=UPI001E4998AE|nr:tRNA pseudouridine(13) synthase TruD [Planctobacterium marinum]MCC2605270.1 tRNA pseudouridine(13) synthase TruD [Planctobacterium marinum]
MNQFPHIHHWHYLHGTPAGSATLKAEPAHFQVNEVLPFAPSGEGEHLFLQIRKTGLNTGFVAQQLASHYKVKERDVGYAGRKDKHAVTTQWFSVWLAQDKAVANTPFVFEGCEVLDSQWHHKKLRPGNLSHNEFTILLTDVQEADDLNERLANIAKLGVPNYFGPQRFGNLNADGVAGNLVLAEFLLKGQTIRKREKRNLAISALRSWLFNQAVSERLHTYGIEAQNGEVFSLTGSNSFFLAEAIDESLQQRLQSRDIQLSAPLWGQGTLPSGDQILDLENQLASQYPEICDTLSGLGLKQERRKLLLFPEQLQCQQSQQQITLKFSLPSGCFATSVIRELLRLN